MKYKLKDIGKIVGGGTPSTKHSEYYAENGIGWITPKDLSRYHRKYIFHGQRDISRLGLNHSSAKSMPTNSILVSSRAPIGYVAMAGDTLTTNQGFKNIVPDISKVLPDYLYYLMLNSKDKLEQVASGSTFKEVSGKTMKDFEVDIPEFNKQYEVVSRLNPIIQKIEYNYRLNDNLLELISLIWNQYRNNISRKITLKSLAKNIITGKTPSTKVKENYGTDVPFVKIPDMHNKVFVDETTQNLSALGANSQKSKYLPTNTIMVSCIGTPGLVSLAGRVVQTNQQINSLILDDKYTYWVFFELRSLKNKIGNLGSGGTTIRNLNKSDFSNIEIKIPNTKDMLDDFSNIARSMFEQIHANCSENRKLIQLKKTLLNEYF